MKNKMDLRLFLETINIALDSFKNPKTAQDECYYISKCVYHAAKAMGIEMERICGYAFDQNKQSVGHFFLRFWDKKSYILDYTLNQFYSRKPKPFPFLEEEESIKVKRIFHKYFPYNEDDKERLDPESREIVSRLIDACKQAQRLVRLPAKMQGQQLVLRDNNKSRRKN